MTNKTGNSPGRNRYRYAICLLLAVLITSCGVKKYIPKDEKLYKGATLDISTEDGVDHPGQIKRELRTVVRPQPNSRILGMRLGLYFHYKAQKENPGFLMRWLNRKFGEEPVYFSDTDPKRIEELMLNRLDNRGFFYSKVQGTIDSTARYAGVKYHAEIESPYTMESFELDRDSLPVYDAIDQALQATEITEGKRFDLELMKFERERIDADLKQQGYYNFNPDFLIFEADTNQYDNRRFDLRLRLKKETPPKSVIPYIIDSITVFPNYSIESDTMAQVAPVTIDGIDFIQKETFFKPEKLEPYILFEEGQRYNSETSRLTSNRLSALGSYKYVNIRFNEKDTTLANGQGLLSADIFLSPLPRRSIRVELQAVTKSNGFAGPGVAVTYNNRNLFNEGVTLGITGNFSYESQISGAQDTGLNSIAAGLKADLLIPRLIPMSPSSFRYAVPKTKISLGGDILKRSKLYTLASVNANFGYTWNANRYVYHELNPVSVNYVSLSQTTAEFDTILDKNPFLRQSFEQKFLAGLNYTFTYNELVAEEKEQPIFFSTSLDVAGNTLSLLSGGQREVFGLEYAQYARADIDFRYYFRLRNEQTLATRVYGGWGIPYGNSSSLPFVKQFFSGGPYSVRAFPIRSLGPGAYQSEESGTSTFFDRSGNLRLEANLEYRFPIWSYLKGAVFADAGNVWLTGSLEIPEDSTEENRAFNEQLKSQGSFGSDWLKELGVGVGFGLRVDIRNFVIRLDLASPLQVPYFDEGERLRTPFLDGGDNNLVFNFAIGYPF